MIAPQYMITASELGRLVGEPPEKIAGYFNLTGRRPGIPPHMVKEYLIEKGIDYSFKVIAHINMRGGIGKTTTTITAAARAAQYGYRTCILDLDPQGSSSLAFNKMPAEEDPIFYDIWQNPSSMLMPSLKTVQDCLYILPSSLENGLLDLSLINPGAQKNAVRGVCEELKAKGFDLALIDCPPSLGTAVISTICASDIIVIPVCSDAFSFKGLELTLKEISSICDTFNLKRPGIRILYTKFDRREKISEDALNRLSSDFAELLIPSVIRTSTSISRALERRETVFASPRKCTAKEDYDMYVRYILGMDDSLR